MSEIPQGAIRFNTDSQRLEFYAQGEWWVMSTDTPNLGRGSDSTPGTRGMFVGGHPSTDTIDYVNIASTGNAADFGNLTKARQESGGFANSTRALAAGDAVPGSDNTIDFWTIPTTGNAQDFGDLNATSDMGASAASPTKAIHHEARNATPISAVMIATTGNSTDFGDTATSAAQTSGCSNGHGGL